MTETNPNHPPRHSGRRRRRNVLLSVLIAVLAGLLLVILITAAVGRMIVNGHRSHESGLTGTEEILQIIPVAPTTEETEPPTQGDVTPPEIHGVRPIVTFEGDAVSYRAGVSITDDTDLVPALSILTDEVDLSTPGLYSVIYEATDDAGNITREETTVEVRPKKEGYVPVDVIYQKADEMIDVITDRTSSQSEQCRDIYNWLRSHCVYTGDSDKSDVLQGAYQMYTTMKGDCFSFYAASKVLFDRLGIDNIDVRKVKASDRDSDHYWSLVSLDDGETWYHFDCTPRAGQYEDFCLTSDAFLDEYSERHNGSHNRDMRLYPPTPEMPYGQ